MSPSFRLPDWVARLGRRLSGHVLIAALMGVGLTLPLRLALGLPLAAWSTTMICTGIALALAVLRLNRWLNLAGILTLSVAAALWLAAQRTLLTNLPALFTLLSQGHGVALRLFAVPLASLFAVAITAIVFTLTRHSGGFYPLLSLTTTVLLGVWFFGERSSLLYCLPAMLGLVLLFGLSSDEGTPLRRILPVAIGAVLLAILLLPRETVTNPTLEQTAEELRQIVRDHLFFTEPRNPYSLQRDGYLPMGSDTQGGPANPLHRPVMDVRTNAQLLLRATTKDTYTGTGWVDAGSGARNLYIDPRLTGLRNHVFDALRPDVALRRSVPGIFAPQQVEVTMTAPGVSTLFLTQRYDALHTDSSMVPYFNASSEVFITRDTVPADRYTFTAYAMNGDTPGIPALLDAARGQQDDHWSDVRERYLALPGSVEGQVRDLANTLTAAATTPYGQAMALAEYLRSTFPYTLDQNVPPQSRDFVSWFLLQERQGYCTSFAASLAVLGRIAGLPTRYVEGYSVVPDADGVARVTGLQAHAWTEIYFQGFGWLPFDATPPTSPNSQSGQEPPPPVGDDTPPEQTPPPTPSPEPETPPPDEPEQSPEPQPDEPTPSPEPQADEPTPTPTPEPTPPPEEPPLPSEPPEEPPDPPDAPLWILWALMVLMAAAALAWRILRTAPSRVATAQQDGDARLMAWYRGLTMVLRAQGIAPLASESPLTYLERAEATLAQRDRDAAPRKANPQVTQPPLPALTPVANAVCALRYGNLALEAPAYELAEQAYGILWDRLTLRQKIRVLWQRMLHGLGSLQQVP